MIESGSLYVNSFCPNKPAEIEVGITIVIVNNSTSKGDGRFSFGDGTVITPDSTCKIYLATGSNKLLDVTDGATANGTTVELYSNVIPTTPNQVWEFVTVAGGYYKIPP